MAFSPKLLDIEWSGPVLNYRDEAADDWVVAEDAWVRWGKFYIVIRAGFHHDFASVPRFFHRLFPAHGDSDRAAIAHDYVYCTRPYDVGSRARMTRAEADRMFYELLLHDGVPHVRAWAMYKAVRMFGGPIWSAHDPEFRT